MKSLIGKSCEADIHVRLTMSNMYSIFKIPQGRALGNFVSAIYCFYNELSTARVADPTYPDALIPYLIWNARTASKVVS